MSKQMHHQLLCMARPIAPALLSTTLITLMFGLTFPTVLQAQPAAAVPMAVNPNLATSNNAAPSSNTITGSAAPGSANVTNAERLIELLDMEKSTTLALAEMVSGIHRQMQPVAAAIKSRGIDPAPSLKEIGEVVRKFQESVNWLQIKPALIQIMNDTYTPEQLQAVVDFMSSPLMQGLPVKMSQANQKTEEMIRGHLNRLSTDIQGVMNKAMAAQIKKAAVGGINP